MTTNKPKPYTAPQMRLIAFLRQPGAMFRNQESYHDSSTASALLRRGTLSIVPKAFHETYWKTRAELCAAIGLAAAQERDYWGAASAFHDAAVMLDADEPPGQWLCLTELKDHYTPELAVKTAKDHHKTGSVAFEPY